MSYQFNTNLNVPIVENQAVTTMAAGYDTNTVVAKLFVFAPEYVGDTTKRSHTYNLSQNFIEDVSDTVEKSLTGEMINSKQSSYMSEYESALTAILPSNEGHHLSTSRFQDFWRFILQLDNIDNVTSTNIYTGPKLATRRVYCGICMEEPCVQNMGRIVENPSTILKILHVSVLNAENRYSPAGNVQTMRLKQDTDIMPPDVVMMLNSNITEVLRPQDVLSATAESPHGLFVSDHNSFKRNIHRPLVIDSSFNSPTQHMADMVFGIMSGVDNIVSNAATSSIFTGEYAPRWGVSTDLMEASLNQGISRPSQPDPYGLDPTIPIDIGTLRSKFPNLQVIPAQSMLSTRSDLADQSILTRSNKGCDIVVSTVPVIAANVGLSEIAFRYASYRPNNNMFTMGNTHEDAFMVDNFATWAQEPAAASKGRIQSFLGHFRKQLTPRLVALGGDFELMCSYTSGGICDAMLIYHDDPSGTMGIYQSPLFLGGINSPVIGTHGLKVHNGSHLQSLKAGVIANLSGASASAFATMPEIHMSNPVSQFAEQLFSSSPF